MKFVSKELPLSIQTLTLTVILEKFTVQGHFEALRTVVCIPA